MTHCIALRFATGDEPDDPVLLLPPADIFYISLRAAAPCKTSSFKESLKGMTS